MMTSRVTLSVLAALAAMMTAACDRQEAAPRPPVQAADSEPATADRAETTREDPRDAPVAKVDGKPMWAANRRYTAEENADYQFKQHGDEFGASSVDDFVRKVHAFTAKPPAGTERFERANGDTLLYDSKGNVFAVVTETGAPRTMFKPTGDGAAYWAKQKADATARASRPARNEG